MSAAVVSSPINAMSVTSGLANVSEGKHRLKLRFEVIRKLGQGAYGKVQLAINKETGKEVAIKTIKKSKVEGPKDLMRIRREIQILSSIQHPHIIHIFEVFENKDKIVLVMQFARGGELFDYLSEHKPLSDSEARRLFRQIATAIYYCHKNKVCHRDLKLENVLLDEKGNAKIGDFGLSNVFDAKHQLSTFCGSPLYASPEIMRGQPYYGPEVDCWSLGVLLYTLIYGAMPFDGQNYNTLVKKIQTADYFEPEPKSEASVLIKKLLCVDPNRRATIIDVCTDAWVNRDSEPSLLQVAEDLANLTPVKIEMLVALAPINTTTTDDKSKETTKKKKSDETKKENEEESDKGKVEKKRKSVKRDRTSSKKGVTKKEPLIEEPESIASVEPIEQVELAAPAATIVESKPERKKSVKRESKSLSDTNNNVIANKVEEGTVSKRGSVKHANKSSKNEQEENKPVANTKNGSTSRTKVNTSNTSPKLSSTQPRSSLDRRASVQNPKPNTNGELSSRGGSVRRPSVGKLSIPSFLESSNGNNTQTSPASSRVGKLGEAKRLFEAPRRQESMEREKQERLILSNRVSDVKNRFERRSSSTTSSPLWRKASDASESSTAIESDLKLSSNAISNPPIDDSLEESPIASNLMTSSCEPKESIISSQPPIVPVAQSAPTPLHTAPSMELTPSLEGRRASVKRVEVNSKPIVTQNSVSGRSAPTSYRSSVDIRVSPRDPMRSGESSSSISSSTSTASSRHLAPILRSYKKISFTKDGGTITETGKIVTQEAPGGGHVTKEIVTQKNTKYEPTSSSFGPSYNQLPSSSLAWKRTSNSSIRKSDSTSSSGSVDIFDEIFDTWTGDPLFANMSNRFRGLLNSPRKMVSPLGSRMLAKRADSCERRQNDSISSLTRTRLPSEHSTEGESDTDSEDLSGSGAGPLGLWKFLNPNVLNSRLLNKHRQWMTGALDSFEPFPPIGVNRQRSRDSRPPPPLLTRRSGSRETDSPPITSSVNNYRVGSATTSRNNSGTNLHSGSSTSLSGLPSNGNTSRRYEPRVHHVPIVREGEPVEQSERATNSNNANNNGTSEFSSNGSLLEQLRNHGYRTVVMQRSNQRGKQVTNVDDASVDRLHPVHDACSPEPSSPPPISIHQQVHQIRQLISQLHADDENTEQPSNTISKSRILEKSRKSHLDNENESECGEQKFESNNTPDHSADKKLMSDKLNIQNKSHLLDRAHLSDRSQMAERSNLVKKFVDKSQASNKLKDKSHISSKLRLSSHCTEQSDHTEQSSKDTNSNPKNACNEFSKRDYLISAEPQAPELPRILQLDNGIRKRLAESRLRRQTSEPANGVEERAPLPPRPPAGRASLSSLSTRIATNKPTSGSSLRPASSLGLTRDGNLRRSLSRDRAFEPDTSLGTETVQERILRKSFYSRFNEPASRGAVRRKCSLSDCLDEFDTCVTQLSNSSSNRRSSTPISSRNDSLGYDHDSLLNRRNSFAYGSASRLNSPSRSLVNTCNGSIGRSSRSIERTSNAYSSRESSLSRTNSGVRSCGFSQRRSSISNGHTSNSSLLDSHLRST